MMRVCLSIQSRCSHQQALADCYAVHEMYRLVSHDHLYPAGCSCCISPGQVFGHVSMGSLWYAARAQAACCVHLLGMVQEKVL